MLKFAADSLQNISKGDHALTAVKKALSSRAKSVMGGKLAIKGKKQSSTLIHKNGRKKQTKKRKRGFQKLEL